jgi:hypothetical protein
MQLVIFFTTKEEVPNHNCRNMGACLASNDKRSSPLNFFSCYLQAPSGPLLCIRIAREKMENELGTKIMLCCLCFCYMQTQKKTMNVGID